MLNDGVLNCYWVQCNNNMQAGPNINTERLPGYRNPENFIVVSDPYPTATAQAADLILPTAMWIEKEGAYGNAERRTQAWYQQVGTVGDAKSDLWQVMEFSKRFKMEEVWPEELLAKAPQYRGKTMYDMLFKNGQVDKFPLEEARELNDDSHHFGFYVQKGLFEEYATFGRGHGHDLAPYDVYHTVRGLRCQSLMVKKHSGALKKARTHTRKRALVGISTAMPTVKRRSSLHRTKRHQKCQIQNSTYGYVQAVFLSTGTLVP